MRKQGFAVIIAAIILSLTFPLFYSHADVIVEPDNDFYTRNAGRCEMLFRGFCVNGKDGFVVFRTEPGASDEVARINNGAVVYIQYTYDHHGEIWGVTGFDWSDTYNRWASGWAPMDQLLLMYDYISFAEDHESELLNFNGNCDALIEAKNIVCWTWPGSGEYTWILESPYKDNLIDIEWMREGRYNHVTRSYEDGDGRVWVFIQGAGIRNQWVCLSDPSNIDIPAFNPAPETVLGPAVDIIQETNNHRDESAVPKPVRSGGEQLGRRGLPPPVLIIILVAALVAVTIVLIRVFWKRGVK